MLYHKLDDTIEEIQYAFKKQTNKQTKRKPPQKSMQRKKKTF